MPLRLSMIVPSLSETEREHYFLRDAKGGMHMHKQKEGYDNTRVSLMSSGYANIDIPCALDVQRNTPRCGVWCCRGVG